MGSSAVEGTQWAQLGLFGLYAAVLGFMSWGSKSFHRRMKALLLGTGFFTVMASSVSTGLGQGIKVRSDNIAVPWERYALLTVYLPMIVGEVVLSVDPHWWKIIVPIIVQIFSAGILVFGEISSTYKAVWSAAIFSGFLSFFVMGVYLWYFLRTPIESNVTPTWSKITIVVTWLLLFLYVAPLYILSEGFTQVFDAYQPVGSGIYLGMNGLIGLWALYVFRAINLEDDIAGIDASPLLNAKVTQGEPPVAEPQTPPPTSPAANAFFNNGRSNTYSGYNL